MKRTTDKKPPLVATVNTFDVDPVTGRTYGDLFYQEVDALVGLGPTEATIHAFLVAIQDRRWLQTVPGSFMVPVALKWAHVTYLRVIVREYIVTTGRSVVSQGMEWVATEDDIMCRLPLRQP